MNENPVITHSVTLADHNFIVQTLNRNPLCMPVMDVAALIQHLNAAAQRQVDKLKALVAEDPSTAVLD